MKELLDFAAKHGFGVSKSMDVLVIDAPDQIWSWTIYEGLVCTFQKGFGKALNKRTCVDDEEAACVALESMKLWLLNAERS